MTKEALDTLFNCCEFYKYDTDLYEYESIFNGLVKQYDYKTLTTHLFNFVRENANRDVYNKKSHFSNYMSKNNLPKKTDQEYMEDDEKAYQEFIGIEKAIEDIKSRVPKNCISYPRRNRPDVTKNWIGTPFEIYINYSFNYLRQISLERNKPITKLCEIKGLNYNWLRWEKNYKERETIK